MAAQAAPLLERAQPDTSMGLTPLGGSVMGTRSGRTLTPTCMHIWQHPELGFLPLHSKTLLNSPKSGLLGCPACTNDMRQLEQARSEAMWAPGLAIRRVLLWLARPDGLLAAQPASDA